MKKKTAAPAAPAPPTYEDYHRSFTYELNRLSPQQIEVILLAAILTAIDPQKFAKEAYREFTSRGLSTDLF